MIKTKSLLILLSIFSITILSPHFSEAAIYTQGYDFGNVEVGSAQTTVMSISNLDGNEVEFTMTFSLYSCSDFSIKTSLPQPMSIPPNETVNVEIGYSPSSVGECSATLRIYTGSPIPSNE